MGESSVMHDEAARRALKADLARFNCRVAQPDDPPLFTRQPNSAAQTVLWRWTDLEPLLDRLGQELAIGSGGQRRTLRLHNPGLPYGTTPTFWASIQVILPGEVAQAHRHSANAFRFIMKGRGATTTVNGERYPMNEGDLVLTPGMMWHDHEYHGREPMVWLDVLDISLMRSLHATFFEPGHEDKQPLAAAPDRSEREWGSGLMSPPGALAGAAVNPLLVYPHAMADAALGRAAALPSDGVDDTVLEYRNPATGGPAMRTMGMRLQRLRPGFRGKARRHTGSKLYYVVRGAGATTVDGQDYNWTQGDFLTIAPWAWHAHANRSGSADAVLFQVNDFPTLSALGFHAEETQDQAHAS
ncbi:MAG TPA: cupin domain-containing protein [Ramlibacter sp.]|nr:cupin domain-containing protein [Ramlibacter sp.]